MNPEEGKEHKRRLKINIANFKMRTKTAKRKLFSIEKN